MRKRRFEIKDNTLRVPNSRLIVLAFDNSGIHSTFMTILGLKGQEGEWSLQITIPTMIRGVLMVLAATCLVKILLDQVIINISVFINLVT